ncbi:acyl-CoA thioesterase-1 [Stella humosa]|uniref:Acyl-CoA thioesterase-1 n=1 Tax=Stella humosa TaxID=94 RepID=A0A3N1KRM8_9PROT|nr:acyl-CoA thioesterase-1 [Stella humosa]
MDQPETVSGTGGGWRGGSDASGADRFPSRSYGAIRRRFNAGLLALLVVVATTWPAMAAPRKLLALGDSLTAGYGLPAPDGFTARLEAALRAAGRDVSVMNAGVSGDTTAGGLARVDWALADKPDAALVALGANDALRGLSPADAERNLDAILAKLKAAGVPTLLVGMMAPPNLGRDYGVAFDGIYRRLADRHGVALYPFFLDGVAADPGLNQGDGIHPNAKGVAIMVERIRPAVERLLDGK